MKFKLIAAVAFLATATIMTGCKDDSEADIQFPDDNEGGLYINEIYPNNPDWIELYNSTDEPIDLSGYTLQDSKGSAEQYVIEHGTVIGARSFLVFDEGDNFEFGISNDGDNISLLNAGGRPLDNVAFREVGGNKSYGRTTDGGSQEGVLDSPTKGRSNGGGTSAPDPSDNDLQLYLNEVKVSDFGSDGDDWIELYNAGNSAINIGGFTLSDAKADWTIPAGTTIPAKGFVTFTEGSHFEFGLSADGESVTLADASGAPIDYIETPSGLDDDEYPAYARTTDGGSTWAKTATPTKNAGNGGGKTPDPDPDPDPIGSTDQLMINEVKVSDFGSDGDDWIELYSLSSESIDLSGLRLTDGAGGVYTIPAGTTVSAKGFATFTEGTHFTYGLGKSGEIVTLTDAARTQIDRIALPRTELADDVNPAYARIPDGGNTWQATATPTKNAGNRAGAVENPDPDPDPDPSGDYSQLFINEVKVSDFDGDGDDFIELYNATGSPINIGGFKLSDAKASWTIPAGTTIAAGGFITFTEGDDFSYGLSADGETVTLATAAGVQIDRIETPGGLDDDEYPAYARTTDGGSTWAKTATPTKNASNR